MKKVLAVAFLIFAFCAPAPGQSVSIQTNRVGANLKTVDTVAVLVTLGKCEIPERLTTVDAVLASVTRAITVTFLFPTGGNLSISGNVVTFRTTASTATVGISAAPGGATVSASSITVTGP